MIEELIHFMNLHDIPFINKDLSKKGLYNYNLSPTLKSVLYTKGKYYVEDLIGINIMHIKHSNGVGAGLLDELLDFLIENKIPYTPLKNCNRQRLKNTNLTLRAKNIIYDRGIFYLEDLQNKNIDEIIKQYKIIPSIAQEIREFLKSYNDEKNKQKSEDETQQIKVSENNGLKKRFEFSLENIKHFFSKFKT